MPHPVLVARRLRQFRLDDIGFRCEGRLRENVRVGDEWRDDMPYALLAPSF